MVPPRLRPRLRGLLVRLEGGVRLRRRFRRHGAPQRHRHGVPEHLHVPRREEVQLQLHLGRLRAHVRARLGMRARVPGRRLHDRLQPERDVHLDLHGQRLRAHVRAGQHLHLELPGRRLQREVPERVVLPELPGGRVRLHDGGHGQMPIVSSRTWEEGEDDVHVGTSPGTPPNHVPAAPGPLREKIARKLQPAASLATLPPAPGPFSPRRDRRGAGTPGAKRGTQHRTGGAPGTSTAHGASQCDFFTRPLSKK